MLKLKFEPIDNVPRVPNQVLCNRNLHRRLMEFLLTRNFSQRLVRNLMKAPIVMRLAIDVPYTRLWSNNGGTIVLTCNESFYIM